MFLKRQKNYLELFNPSWNFYFLQMVQNLTNVWFKRWVRNRKKIELIFSWLVNWEMKKNFGLNMTRTKIVYSTILIKSFLISWLMIQYKPSKMYKTNVPVYFNPFLYFYNYLIIFVLPKRSEKQSSAIFFCKKSFLFHFLNQFDHFRLTKWVKLTNYLTWRILIIWAISVIPSTKQTSSNWVSWNFLIFFHVIQL